MGSIVNFEFKAKSKNLDEKRSILLGLGANSIGVDHQIDTYYQVDRGRLKLRQGNIENTLIHYNRENKSGPKKSDVSLFKTGSTASLKTLLDKALDQKVVVDKKREILFIGNTKFHLDRVEGLGEFIEVEVISDDPNCNVSLLKEKCDFYLEKLMVGKDDLIDCSYSDLLGK
ncbi:MAG: class IV adenylate cyclase [Bacteriovoracaceae bacterium]|jgi:adenylate cyclase, class 2|nr:class IV adenylate cyclase [Bacteriovoracaceae bacterium]